MSAQEHHHCPDCARAHARANAAIIDMENTEKDLRVMRRRLTALQQEILKLQQPEHLEAEAEAVFLYWREECRSASKRKVVFGDKRKTKVMARLKDGYTVEDLKKAIDGARDHAFVSEDGKRFDDLELICRDETKVDSFIQRAEVVSITSKQAPPMTMQQAREKILDGLTREYGWDAVLHDQTSECWVAPCPNCRSDHSSLRLRSNHMEPLLFCTICDINQSRLLAVLD